MASATLQQVNLGGDDKMTFPWKKSYILADPNLFASGAGGAGSTVTALANPAVDSDGVTKASRGCIVGAIYVWLSAAVAAGVAVTLSDTVNTYTFYVGAQGQNQINFDPPLQLTPNKQVTSVVGAPGAAVAHTQFLNAWLER